MTHAAASIQRTRLGSSTYRDEPAVRLWPRSREQGQFPPFPVAVNVNEPNLPQPSQLCVDIQQLIRGVLSFGGDSESGEELLVKRCCGRRYVLKIAKHSAWYQVFKHLAIQRPLAGVRDVVNGEAEITASIGPRSPAVPHSSHDGSG